MVTRELLDAQAAFDLPSREMMNRWATTNVNIAVPIIIQNNISIQVCAIGCTQYQGGQWNNGGIVINWR